MEAVADQIESLELASFEERATRVLATTFLGMHHCPKIKKLGPEWPMWELNTWNDLSTYDCDLLTRLVVMAHEECVRVSISSSGPRMVKIRLWPRNGRDGKFCDRHPTIEQAVESVRKSVWKS